MNERVAGLRERSKTLDHLLAVVDKGGQDNAGHLAAVIAFFSFFSLFPLLMVLVWVLGKVLASQPDLQDKILDSAIGKFPLIGDQIEKQVKDGSGSLEGGPIALATGLGGALWGGTKAFEAFERAMHVVWHGPAVKHESLVKRKVRAVTMMGALGLGIVVSAAGSSLPAAVSWIPGAAQPAAVLVAVALNVALVLVSFHLATPGNSGWRSLLPGSVIAGSGLTFLFGAGTVFLTRVVDNAGDTYGTFALVIGLLTWLNLIGSLLVWSAEVNSVLAGKRAMDRTKLQSSGRLRLRR